jgi:hypothetical protein
MHDKVTKRLIFLLGMSKNYKIFFHGCHYFFSRHIHKVENKDKKQTKNVGLMGVVCSNNHGHENNQVNGIS